MIELSSFRPALNHGISYLKSQQLKTGGFASQSSAKIHDFSEALSFQTVFASTLLLQNLAALPGTAELASLKNELIEFLLNQKSSQWSWNYWDRQSVEFQKLPYPDDLDDSFCALTALQLAQPQLITGEVLAQAIHLLTSLETAEGGPYKTWLVKANAPAVWHDVDLGVNLNIGYFLQLHGVELPALTNLFDAALKDESITTPYYPLPLPILFFASRFLQSPKQKLLLKQLLLKTPAETSLEVALKLLSLLNLGENNKGTVELAEKLLKMQNADGSWSAATFYTGVNPAKNQKFFAGSAPLTTSFSLLALHKAADLAEQRLKKAQGLSEKLKQKVLRKVTQRFAELSPDLQTTAKRYLKEVHHNDGSGQITLLPWLFCQAVGKTAIDIAESQLITLGAASVYGWIAYTIYDDFLDAEAQVETLPLANCCLRELTSIFTQILPAESGFEEVFQKVMDHQEAANAWEVTHCRFNPTAGWRATPYPDFGDLSPLAQRSLGHSLGCVALLMQLGNSAEDEMVKNLQQFFHHFLIARQLNDDAHDWEADLARGQVNAVGAKVLLVPVDDRKKLFWSETIDWVCDTMQQHIDAAAVALQKITILEHPEILRKLLAGQTRAINLVQTERKKALDFLESYQTNPQS